MKNLLSKLTLTTLVGLSMAGCAVTESAQSISSEDQVEAIRVNYNKNLQPLNVVVANFENQAGYNNGAFASSNNLAREGYFALSNALTTSQYYKVLSRNEDSYRAYENNLKFGLNSANLTKGADYLISGQVVEFGRRNQGDHQLFGAIGSGKQQIAYAKVVLNLIDAQTSEIVASSQGAGQISIDQRQVLGFGNFSSYDTAQNSKVLGIAIRKAVNEMSNAVEKLHARNGGK